MFRIQLCLIEFCSILVIKVDFSAYNGLLGNALGTSGEEPVSKEANVDMGNKETTKLTATSKELVHKPEEEADCVSKLPIDTNNESTDATDDVNGEGTTPVTTPQEKKAKGRKKARKERPLCNFSF